jgi:hypothetical protein
MSTTTINTTDLVKALEILANNPALVKTILSSAKHTVTIEPKPVKMPEPQPDALKYAGSTVTGSSVTKYGKVRDWQAVTVYGSYVRTEDGASMLRIRENGEARVIALATFTGSINRRWPTGISTESWKNGRRIA